MEIRELLMAKQAKEAKALEDARMADADKELTITLDDSDDELIAVLSDKVDKAIEYATKFNRDARRAKVKAKIAKEKIEKAEAKPWKKVVEDKTQLPAEKQVTSYRCKARIDVIRDLTKAVVDNKPSAKVALKAKEHHVYRTKLVVKGKYAEVKPSDEGGYEITGSCMYESKPGIAPGYSNNILLDERYKAPDLVTTVKDGKIVKVIKEIIRYRTVYKLVNVECKDETRKVMPKIEKDYKDAVLEALPYETKRFIPKYKVMATVDVNRSQMDMSKFPTDKARDQYIWNCINHGNNNVWVLKVRDEDITFNLKKQLKAALMNDMRVIVLTPSATVNAKPFYNKKVKSGFIEKTYSKDDVKGVMNHFHNLEKKMANLWDEAEKAIGALTVANIVENVEYNSYDRVGNRYRALNYIENEDIVKRTVNSLRNRLAKMSFKQNAKYGNFFVTGVDGKKKFNNRGDKNTIKDYLQYMSKFGFGDRVIPEEKDADIDTFIFDYRTVGSNSYAGNDDELDIKAKQNRVVVDGKSIESPSWCDVRDNITDRQLDMSGIGNTFRYKKMSNNYYQRQCGDFRTASIDATAVAFYEKYAKEFEDCREGEKADYCPHCGAYAPSYFCPECGADNESGKYSPEEIEQARNNPAIDLSRCYLVNNGIALNEQCEVQRIVRGSDYDVELDEVAVDSIGIPEHTINAMEQFLTKVYLDCTKELADDTIAVVRREGLYAARHYAKAILDGRVPASKIPNTLKYIKAKMNQDIF